MAGRRRREIYDTPQYRRQVEELSVTVERLPEILVGVEWALARQPDAFHEAMQIREDTRMMRTKSNPPLIVMFQFDDTGVTLLGLWEALSN